jgi:hypothetical protein
MPTDPLSRVDAWGGAWEAVEDVPCQPCIWLKKGYRFRGFKTGSGGLRTRAGLKTRRLVLGPGPVLGPGAWS